MSLERRKSSGPAASSMSEDRQQEEVMKVKEDETWLYLAVYLSVCLSVL